MGTLFVDKLDPQSGTSLELGSSGDTMTVPSGATLSIAGTINASSGTATGFGEANTPYFMSRLASDQTLSDGADTIYQGQASIDSASGWNNSNYTYTIPSGQGGYWYCWGQSDIRQDGGASCLDIAVAFMSKNSTTNNLNQFTAFWDFNNNPAKTAMPTFANLISLSAGDVLRMHVRGNVISGAGVTPRCDSEHSWFGGFRLAT